MTESKNIWNSDVQRGKIAGHLFAEVLLFFFVKADKVFLKPANFSFEEAAAVPTSGLIALEACQKANIRTGSSVLVYGASGGVGQFAVQIAKALGGTVTAVCSSRNIENMYALGADDVIDYTRTDINIKIIASY